jgi:hypothetical protein
MPNESIPLAQTRLLDVAREFLRVLFMGWWLVARGGLTGLRRHLSVLTFAEIAFLLATAGLMLASLFPWIVYEADLMFRETSGRGSNYRMLFFLPGPLGLFLYLIGGRSRLIIYYGVAILVGILYVIGIFLPNPIHTYMRNPAEYRLEFWLYAYGGCLAVCAATAHMVLQRALIPIAAIKAFLAGHRDPGEPPGK